MTEPLLLTDVRLPGKSRKGQSPAVDVLLADGAVEAVTPSSTKRPPGVEVFDAAGRWLLPGLWDNHVHFAQWAIQQQRLDLSSTSSAAECLTLVRGAVQQQQGGPLVGYGFRDGLWPDVPSAAALDAVSGALPVVLISADLHCAWINTAAQQLLEVQAEQDGLVREDAWFGALEKVQNPADLTSEQYARVARDAARRGVVGVVDFENTDNISLWPHRVSDGVDSLRVEISVWPDRLQGAISAGLKTGDPVDERGLITMGPLKVVVDGSLNTRTAWCWDPYPGLDPAHPHACGTETVPIDQLQELMGSARDAGLSAAIHAIGDRANTAVLDAFESLGMTGVIEHAQLIREADFPRFAELGLAASVQPEHAMDDRDVADAYWADRTGRAFALRTLHESGVALHLGSDAPVSPLDPWCAIASAVTRSRDDRQPWHPEQSIALEVALAASSRGRTGVRVGDPADLVLVDRDPYTCSGDQLRSMPVAATLLGGRFTWFGLQ
ncbi:amidohydrolase [Nesterenkonia muleiensis]|uniref:amidohydrolase n=1 Tax=Nesterenkonia muleiensis TaxID=2282648 RepID=UPI001EE48275|nr:amidohydrolase family protein [Nesterenkonia muleiensis]